jgi:hypothetical protein
MLSNKQNSSHSLYKPILIKRYPHNELNHMLCITGNYDLDSSNVASFHIGLY